MSAKHASPLWPLFCAPTQKTFTFVDVFAGCGGLSLGFSAAGGKGLFAVEKSNDAFLTFRANFLQGPSQLRFEWPGWLPEGAISISSLLKRFRAELVRLRGKVDVVVGGPPCQGFSFAGRRRPTDPRNELFRSYVEFISLLQPKMVVLENVPGMKAIHQKHSERKTRQSHFEKLMRALERAGYVSEGLVLDAASFGVPQRRPRLIAIGVRKGAVGAFNGSAGSLFALVEKHRSRLVEELGLHHPITAEDAIGDLITKGRKLVPCVDPSCRGDFLQAEYAGPISRYQKLMNHGCGRALNSMRLANHTSEVRARFDHILESCLRGIKLNEAERRRLGMKKHRTVPLAPDAPCPTLTTLPDDLLHFGEPRILTVREYARLQSFPDWFRFAGKYTTGGYRRRTEAPRYTQIGNAVPPLFAHVIAQGIAEAMQIIRARNAPKAKTLDRSKVLAAA